MLQRYFSFPDRWFLICSLCSVILLTPIIAIFILAFFPSENIWPHLLRTTLGHYVFNTLFLLVFVGIGTAIVGTTTAWLVTMRTFPLRKVLDFLLLAPLAMPAYINAYAMVDFFEYAGVVQTALREIFNWSSSTDYWFPEIRTRVGAGIVLIFALYPYTFLLARAAFREQSLCAIDVSRTLGCSQWQVFLRVGLPLARPAIFVGVAMAMMETLNDFGTVDYFAVQTLTVGVFNVWLQSYNLGGAAQISSILLLFVFMIFLLEFASRRKKKFHHTSRRYRPIYPAPLSPFNRWLTAFLCLLPVFIGFILPVIVVGLHAIDGANIKEISKLVTASRNTALLATAASVVTVVFALLMIVGNRTSGTKLTHYMKRAASIGYAAPGAVLAVGLIVPVLFINRAAEYILSLFNIDGGLFLSGTIVLLLYAYVVRFIAVPLGGLESAFERVSPSIELAARTLGKSTTGLLYRVHIPMVKGSAITAALLVFVDATKELPATLLLRPFNFETLATTVYNAASLEQLNEAAPAALLIVIIGLLPVFIIRKQMSERESNT